MWLSEPCFFTMAVVVQLVGLVSMAAARVTERSVAQVFCQQVFCACLLVVGATTVLAVASGVSCWLMCASTLSLMAVGATLDLHRTPQCSAF